MEEIKWVIGAAMSAVGMVGGFLARDRQVMSLIDDGDEAVCRKVEKVQSEINSVKREIQAEIHAVKRDYVRRDDMRDHLQAIERSLQQSRDEQKDLTRRIDALINAMTK